MSKIELTFNNLPEAISTLLSDVKEIKSIVQNKETIDDKRVPINIDQASKLINKAKPTIYTLVRLGKLPAYKNGKRLYFFEDELISWIQSGKLKTSVELREEAINYLKRK